jgi:uncharacterized protein YjbJ (UPF0337 family)
LSSVRKIAATLLMTALGIAMPLAVIQAQSTATPDRREADRSSWAKYKGWTDPAQERWSKLTEDDLQEIDGHREILIGKLQTRYAISYAEAERQVRDFEASRP